MCRTASSKQREITVAEERNQQTPSVTSITIIIITIITTSSNSSQLHAHCSTSLNKATAISALGYYYCHDHRPQIRITTSASAYAAANTATRQFTLSACVFVYSLCVIKHDKFKLLYLYSYLTEFSAFLKVKTFSLHFVKLAGLLISCFASPCQRAGYSELLLGALSNSKRSFSIKIC